MLVGGPHRGQFLWIAPEEVAAVVGPTISTYSPITYRVYLKNGVIFDVDLDADSEGIHAKLEKERA